MKNILDKVISLLLVLLILIITLNLVGFNAKSPLPIIGIISLNYIVLTILIVVFLTKTIYSIRISNGVLLYIFYYLFYIIYSSIVYLILGDKDNIERIPLYINSFIIVLLIIVLDNYLSTKSLKQIFDIIFLVAIMLCLGNLITIYQYVNQLNWNGFDSDGEIILRAYGLYLNPNIAGFFAIVSIILSFNLILFRNKYNTLNLVILIISLIAGLLTFSKTFFLNSFVVLIIYIYNRRKYLKSYVLPTIISKLKYIIFIPLFLLFYFVLSSEDVLDKEQMARLETVFFFLNDSEIDYSGRSELADYGIQMAKEKPIIGSGFGTFTILKESNKLFDFTSSDLGVHNTFIRIWGEGGVISILFYLFFWIHLLWRVYLSKSIEVKLISYMLIFTLNIYSFTSHNIPEDYFSALIILIVCVLLSKKMKIK